MKAESLWLILAFIGGIILKFGLCVLPLLGLKIFALIHSSEEHPRQLKFLGMIFTLGVLASFFALSSVIILMKKALDLLIIYADHCCHNKIGFMLEGGYSLEVLARLVPDIISKLSARFNN